jgi:hypothetical protein
MQPQAKELLGVWRECGPVDNRVHCWLSELGGLHFYCFPPSNWYDFLLQPRKLTQPPFTRTPFLFLQERALLGLEPERLAFLEA